MPYLEHGSIGRFWRLEDALSDDEAEPLYGWVKTEGPYVVVEGIDPRLGIELWNSDPGWTAGTAIIGQLPADVVMILNPRSTGGNRVLAGARASTVRLATNTIVGDVDVSQLRTSKIRAVEVHFNGMATWAGLKLSDETWTTDHLGRTQGYSVAVGDVATTTAAYGRLTIEIGSTWRVAPDDDGAHVLTPTTIRCQAQQPTDINRLIEPLHSIQSLLGMLVGGFLAAHSGSADLDLDIGDGPPANRSPIWCGPLMEPPPGLKNPPSDMGLPLVSLEALGGVAGLSRWCRLTKQHPRATTVSISRYRFGPTVGEVELLALGSAIEYWVAAHRNRQWSQAQKSSGGSGRSFALAMAGQAGPAFTDWVGDTQQWAELFSGAYRGLKHDPTFKIEPIVLHDLVVSGRHLLLAVLLNRVAGNRRPTEQIFRHHTLSRVGERLQQAAVKPPSHGRRPGPRRQRSRAPHKDAAAPTSPPASPP